MTQRQIDREVYRLARTYLLGFKGEGVTAALLRKYMSPISLQPKPTDIPGLYQRILKSAQNANMKAGVIGKAIGGVGNLGKVLEDFNPAYVVRTYGENSELLLKDIKKKLKPRGKMRTEARSIWPKYCKTILSAARFMSQFRTADDYYDWVDLFNKDSRALPALPMAISMEISGIGFPLACDFLKELGYEDFAKPDVHLKYIFKELRLCPESADDYQVFKAIVRVAKHAGVTPYAADKLFWLIGSGNFYDDPAIGKIGRHREDFVGSARKHLRKKGWTASKTAHP